MHTRGGPMNRLWPLLLPELREFPAPEQDAALQGARATALDVLELAGMATGLVAVTALTRYTLADTHASTAFAAALVNFVLALPLLAACLGPFHVRRLRRGLRQRLESRGRR